jgi:nucleoside-diphosphate-sugar epimerase
MRVFVTGASGHLGSAVVPELVGAGHEVIGLARSQDAAARLAAMGAAAIPGSLEDLDALRDAAAAADGVVHLAFRHDAMMAGDLAGAVTADLHAISAITDVLKGTGKAFIGTTGTGVLAMANLNRTATEDDTLPGGYRVDAENLVIGLADHGVRSAVIRLPPTVHSDLDHQGFIPWIIASARRTGTSIYVGDGANRWPAVNTRDAARLYRMALESAPAGTRLHAVAEEGIPFRQIAEHIGARLGVPAVGVSADDAPNYVGFLAPFVALDGPALSHRTQQLMGWTPREVGLLEDLDNPHYFVQPVAGVSQG